jgi:hypothetical protein
MGAQAGAARRWPGLLLWLLALLLMFGAASYQRRTGPSYPLRGTFSVDQVGFDYRLPRSEKVTRDARVELPDPGGEISGELRFKRFGTEDPFRAVGLARHDGSLGAALPAQPPAGKLEYYLLLRDPSGVERRIPGAAGETVIIRFTGEVPWTVLLAHILFIFAALLIGLRAGLAALFRPRGMRALLWTALALMTGGGMILGPVVQRYAFGQYWTGIPFGYDLTDNKMLIMWLVWIAACAVAGRRTQGRDFKARLAVVLATLIMMVVYLIPHSLRGSTLDYEQLDRGVPASDAVETG